MAQMGRIGGPLLADNLLRNGTNLAFDSQVLYLDVVNKRIGANNNAPVTDLYTPTAIDTVNLIVDTTADIGNWVISASTIQQVTSSITISPSQGSNPTIVTPGLSTANLYIYANTISDTVSNDSISITANGTGAINLTGNTTVTGNLHATGTITWDGNVTLGSSSSDTVAFGAEINSNILPSTTNTYNLGSTGSTPALITTGLQINLATAPSTATVGTTWTDTSGNNNNGTLEGNNSHLSYTSNDGGGISISGSETGTYISTSYNIASNTFTISIVASLNPTTYWSSLWGNDSYSAGKGYFAYFISSGDLQVGSVSGTATYSVTGWTNINVWDFVISGTNVTVYQNGTSLGTKTFTAPSGGYATTGLYFASRHANNGSGPTDNCVGTYYAMRVYNVALNSTQILNNYNAVGLTYGLGVSGASLAWATAYANNFYPTSLTTSGITTGSLTGSGTNNLNGNVTIGTTSSNTLGITAEINSNLIPTTTTTYNLGSNSYSWNDAYFGALTNGVVNLTGNTVSIPSSTNTSLKLVANGTGNVVFSSLNLPNSNNVSIGGTLGVTGTTTFNNNVSAGAINQTGSYNITGNATLGAITSVGNITASNPFKLPGVEINGSVISGLTSGTNLQIGAGSNSVEITSSTQFDHNLEITGTLGVTGTSTFANTSTRAITQTGDFNQTGNSNITGNVTAGGDISTSATYFNNGNFNFSGSTITGTVTNGTVYYNANGTGDVWLGGDIKISGNTIINNWINVSVPLLSESGVAFVAEDGTPFYTEFGTATTIQDSLLLTPTGTGNVIITGTTSLILPIGDNLTDILSANGQVRFNDINLNIEGYSSTGYVNFINLYSQDHNTYITPELTPGTADNTLRFAVNGTVTTTITASSLFNNTMYAGNVSFSGNEISNVNNSLDIDLIASGTGRVKFNTYNFVYQNTINLPSSDGLVINSTDKGYVQFTDTTAIQIPSGSSSEYPSVPVSGQTRFNTELNYGEIWNGTEWQPVGGSSAVLTTEEVTDVMWAWDLILG
jgi:hypothetical protein